MPTTPPEPRDPHPADRHPGPDRRPLYYPYGRGCLFWALLLVLIWMLVGLLVEPPWWPWWW